MQCVQRFVWNKACSREGRSVPAEHAKRWQAVPSQSAKPVSSVVVSKKVAIEKGEVA